MNYVKGHLPNYKTPSGSPALMESSVNQAWSRSTTTNLINPMTSPSTTPLPLQHLPQEQLPSSSTFPPAPIFSQPRKVGTSTHNQDIQQHQSRKKLRVQSSTTTDYDNKKTQTKSTNQIPLIGKDVDDDLETITRLEQLHLIASETGTVALSSTQNPHVPRKSAIKSITPKICIANRKDVDTRRKLGINIQDIFKIFKSVIDGIFHKNCEISEQNFYEICLFACSTTPPKDIFVVVSGVLQENITKICQKMESLASEKVNFLSLVVLGWEQCLSVLVKINALFNPLNAKYIIKETKYPSLFHYGKDMYVNMLSSSTKIKTRTINNLVYLITCDRHQINFCKIITSVLRIIHENLPIYAAVFGQELVQSTRQFYQKCASTGLTTLTMEDYMIFALRLIVCEPTAIYDYHKYIPENITLPSRIALEELLSNCPYHLENCFELTKEQGQEQLLKSLYQLFTHHGGISNLQMAFEHHILAECDFIYSDYTLENQDSTTANQPRYQLFVSSFLQLKSRLYSILDTCFDSNKEFCHTLRKCFEESINRDQSTSAQHIAAYMNDLLESIPIFSSSAHSSTLNTLDQCIDLFRHLQAEDIFKVYYKAYLARRLLVYRNQTVLPKEMDMTDRLESECGVEFAKDLYEMINEVRISQLRMTKFEEESLVDNWEDEMELNVNILSGENWAIRLREEKLLLSSEMSTQQNHYNKFYRLENPRSKLTWMASLSTCIVEATYPYCTIQLHTTQYQAMILQLFNDSSVTNWTTKRICQQTGIGEADVIKSLETLTSPKTPLLIRRHLSSTDTIPNTTINEKQAWHQQQQQQDDDEVVIFAYNRTFSTTETMITLPDLLSDLPSTSVKVMNKQELFNKQERLQASLMRILKKHKSLDLMDLWEEAKDTAKSGSRRKYMIKLSSVQNELKVLIDRSLIRNPVDDIYEFCDE